MKTVLFDLDNTLYSEETYVQSGFKYVSKYLGEKYDYDSNFIFSEMMKIFKENGRGKVFNSLLDEFDFDENVFTLVYLYRFHHPDISLYKETIPTLNALKSDYKLGLITDGRSFVQKRKIEALNVGKFFDVVVLTDVLGEKFWKPSVEPYKLALSILNCDIKNSCYVGDDPFKDFKAPKQLGMKSIQVKMEEELQYWKNMGYDRVDADYCVNNLNEILGVLDENWK